MDSLSDRLNQLGINMTTKDILRLDDLPGYDPLPLPFSWGALPRRQCEPGGYKSIAGPAR